MSVDLVRVRAGAYHDSVTLMRVSRTAAELPGVEVALVAMATGLNRGVAADLGFGLPEAGPGDLLVALRGEDRAALEAAAAELDRLLAGLASRTAGGGDGGPAGPDDPGGFGGAAGYAPRTVGAAARALAAGSGPALALVSVPGPYAFAEAMDAIETGLPVMIFSDNVPVEQEVLLKRRAAERDVLVMGPDCGTAVIGGTGLGFANVLRPGPVGMVAASGTGAQQIACLLDLAGVGVRHVLGVGGRDLSAEVGGLSTLRALSALDADPATELIVLVSKPPAPEAARTVRDAVAGLATPVVSALLGPDGGDLTAAAENALRALGAAVPAWPSWSSRPGPGPARGETGNGGAPGPDDGTTVSPGTDGTGGTSGLNGPGGPARRGGATLHGLYAGGTLCAEARLVAGTGRFTDFGDDAYTRGRAHPMIDPTLRLEALAGVPAGDVALLDVVLGHGADPDPAERLAPAVAAAVARGTATVVALVGAEGDPQGLSRQAEALRAAGAAVFASNAQAARHAADLTAGAR
ncbi:FdrA family protein [Streptosporangium sp. NPDC048047]|uniref:FdrA family protein n=1 Tax=Streptosporangium sp. NPDC048047 TaxID=3155748 RepID=UPI00343BB39F